MNESRLIEPLAHGPENAARRLGVSARQIYVLIAGGELKSFKSGKRRMIPDSELQAYVHRKMELAEAA
jgi:excisionase family DNA binding protein